MRNLVDDLFTLVFLNEVSIRVYKMIIYGEKFLPWLEENVTSNIEGSHMNFMISLYRKFNIY